MNIIMSFLDTLYFQRNCNEISLLNSEKISTNNNSGTITTIGTIQTIGPITTTGTKEHS